MADVTAIGSRSPSARAPRDGPVVYKFGGTSVADAQRMRRVAAIVAAETRPLVVVVSALGGVTDRLTRLVGSVAGRDPSDGALLEEIRRRHAEVAEDLCGEGTDRAEMARELDEVLERVRSLEPGEWTGRPAELSDHLLSMGEDLSARLVACALRGSGLDALLVDAREVVRTDERFGRARPDDEAMEELAAARLTPHCAAGRIPVVQGFVGATADGRTTTLGRGGSDFTAVLLGAALDAEEVHIFTDVDGILSGDPRAIEHPMILEEIGFEEAVELSYFGAKVIHPGAAKHAVSRGIDLRIRNTFRPRTPGTVIRSDRRGAAEIAAVAYKPDITLIKVRSHPSAMPYGFLARVFGVLGRHALPVDLVATSHSSTAFTLDDSEDIDAVREELSEFAEVEVTRNLATVTVVGHGLMEQPGTNALVFWAVERTPVHLISQASDVSLSFLVDEPEAAALVRKLHLTLIEFREEEVRKWIE